MTKFQLMTAFLTRKPIEINGNVGLINAIEHEDGSCHKFNVTMQLSDGKGRIIFFIKTID